MEKRRVSLAQGAGVPFEGCCMGAQGRGHSLKLAWGADEKRGVRNDVAKWGSFVPLSQIPGLESVGASAATLG